MDQDYKQVKELFLKVCNLGTTEQAEVLDRECAGNPVLRGEVQSLLEHHEGPTSFVSPAPLVAPRSPVEPPEKIGVYRVLRELGTGGMGVVYLGVKDDRHFKRHVALKVLKRGMDTEDILGRFDLERQVLGAMNHPNVARLYEAGDTDDGLPYFAMEYVDGSPLDQYCDSRRLRISERLDLFRKVCGAVHYAHQNLVVHRDLKPKNILVTKDGEPKLLDFGISKIINPDLVFGAGGLTAPDRRVMTLEYASPEQVRGEPITTASDVYALGVILYELVSGHRPYHLRTPEDPTRFICDQDPDRPSTAASRTEEIEVVGPDAGLTTSMITPEGVSRVREGRPERLRRRLAGDIDNIVLMAMRKEPQRRYQSAEQLGEDIRRHLAGLTVIARPDTLGYRSAKFVRRHRLGVGAAAVIALVLVGGIASTAYALQGEQRQRIRADNKFQQVRELARVFMFDFHDEIQELNGSVKARELLVTTALDYLDGLVLEVGDDAGLKRDLASGYDRVGDIRGGFRNPSLGDTGGALQSYRRGLDLREALLAERPDDLELCKELTTSYMHVGDILVRRGDVNGALGAYNKALELRQQLAEADPVYRRQVAIGLNNVGSALVSVGQLTRAKEFFDRSLAMRRRLVMEDPDNTLKQRDVSVQLLDLGDTLVDMGDPGGALQWYQEALDIREQLLWQEPANGRRKRDAGVADYLIGTALLSLGRPEAATAHIDRCLILFEENARGDPYDARSGKDLALAHELGGRLKAQTGDAAGALRSYQTFQSLMLTLAEADPQNHDYQARVADSYERLAELSLSGRDAAGASHAWGQALEIVEALAAADPADVRHLISRARVILASGRALYELGDAPGAQARLEAARGMYESLHSKQPEHAEIRRGLAFTLQFLSSRAAGDGRFQDALSLTGEAIDLLADLPLDPQARVIRQSLEEDLVRYGR